ncbi:hypothetical protein VOLCADRAFT_100490 [Volvox carteri f. nagariensis]|uniref:Uncharacterized protein n=1 Tax=Volvox carteri f. nagariensis TaxID=3068 RepID=D8UKB4_VOLCA|nr:uncharacterized protein VOLCADRAFT_100490 [Volvox carteri f. nagariensis]EFJ39834.1 hypothetical protein VOLCADRAFT_100490 [Volvox carteri f. nagariensis]|eukprot:XP_002959106.1 hypothetical protein VOLCADRAFT_100490 [Volvox carteri f. nagariensis]
MSSYVQVDIRGTGMLYSSSLGSMAAPAADNAPAAAAASATAAPSGHQPPCVLPEGFVNSKEYLLHSWAASEGDATAWPTGLLACSSFLYRREVPTANGNDSSETHSTSTSYPTAATISTQEIETASKPVAASEQQLARTAADAGGNVLGLLASGSCGGAPPRQSVASTAVHAGGVATTLLLFSPSYWGFGTCVCLRVLGSGTKSVAELGAETAAEVPLPARSAAYILAAAVDKPTQPSPALAPEPAAAAGTAAPTVEGGKVPLRVMLSVVIPVGIAALCGWVVLLVILCSRGSSCSRWAGATASTIKPAALRVDVASGPSMAGMCNTAAAATALAGATSPRVSGGDAGAAAFAATAAAAAVTTLTREEAFPSSLSATKRSKPPGSFPALFGDSVTLVATDVEGSTELWEWQPDVMNTALALHDKLARLTIATCCGYEVYLRRHLVKWEMVMKSLIIIKNSKQVVIGGDMSALLSAPHESRPNCCYAV